MSIPTTEQAARRAAARKALDRQAFHVGQVVRLSEFGHAPDGLGPAGDDVRLVVVKLNTEKWEKPVIANLVDDPGRDFHYLRSDLLPADEA